MIKIGGFQKTTLIDFPGQIAAIVFTKGCNFRCPFCYNRDLVLGNLPTLSQQSIFSFLKKRQGLLTGVVVTGGEPLPHEGLEEFIKKLKKLGYLVKIDTNGSFPNELEKLINKKLVDYVAMDIKTMLDEGYAKAVKQKKFDPNTVKRSLKILLKSKIMFELRTTIVPKIHDGKVLVKMARQLKKIIGKRKVTWFWQNFQPKNCLDPEFEKIEPLKREKLEEFLKRAQKYYPQATLRAS